MSENKWVDYYYAAPQPGRYLMGVFIVICMYPLLKGLYEIRKTWLYSRNCPPLVHGLHVVLQLSSVHSNNTELQYSLVALESKTSGELFLCHIALPSLLVETIPTTSGLLGTPLQLARSHWALIPTLLSTLLLFFLQQAHCVLDLIPQPLVVTKGHGFWFK